jgi:large subunit ribosomal protein L4
MAAVDVIDVKGKKAGSVELPSEVFDVQTNVPLIHQVVVAQLAAARQGTHKTKNRGEVSGAGRKPFKQKGTGRSRQGSVRAPEHTGGGVVHGPVPRKYDQRTPKKMIAAALLGAISDRARGGRLHVHVLSANQLNAYDVLVSDDVVFTQAAYDAFVAAKTKKQEVTK